MLGILSKVLIFGGSAAMVASAMSPVYLLAVYSVVRPFIQPFAFMQYELFGQPITFPLTVIIIGSGIAYTVMKKGWRLNNERTALFTWMIVVSIILAIFSINVYSSFVAISKLVTAWFVLNIALNGIKEQKDVNVLLYGIVISSLFPLAVGFAQSITGQYDFLLDATVERLSSVFGVGNAYGIFLSLITAAVVVLLIDTKNQKGMIFLIGVLVAVLVSQVLALNRGTWIALTGGFLLAAFRYRRYVKLKWIMLLFAFILVFFSKVIYDRFGELETHQRWSGKNTLEARIEYWQDIVPLIADKPLTGYGVGTTGEVVAKYLRREGVPHNDFIRLSLEVGVIGALLYFIFLLRIMIYFLLRPVMSDIWPYNFAMLMVSAYFLVISMTQNVIYNLINFPTYLVLVAIGIRINSLYMKGGYGERKYVSHPISSGVIYKKHQRVIADE